MKRIRWTPEERAAVQERMVQIYAEGRYTAPENVMLRAQQALPVDRRRKVYSSMLHQSKDWMAQARAQAYVVARDRKLTEVAVVAPAVVAPPPSPAELGIPELLEKLVEQLAKRVATEVLSGISEQLSALQKTYQNNQPVLEANPCAPAVQETPKVRRKRVTIVGLKGQQTTVVEQKYPDIDFKFLTSTDAHGREVSEADCTILMTKFIDHSIYAKYRHVHNMKHCNGGVSDLGTILHTVRNP